MDDLTAWTDDVLEKGAARGGKYTRRIPKPGGGYTYVYADNAHHDATHAAHEASVAAGGHPYHDRFHQDAKPWSHKRQGRFTEEAHTNAAAAHREAAEVHRTHPQGQDWSADSHEARAKGHAVLAKVAAAWTASKKRGSKAAKAAHAKQVLAAIDEYKALPRRNNDQLKKLDALAAQLRAKHGAVTSKGTTMDGLTTWADDVLEKGAARGGKYKSRKMVGGKWVYEYADEATKARHHAHEEVVHAALQGFGAPDKYSPHGHFEYHVSQRARLLAKRAGMRRPTAKEVKQALERLEDKGHVKTTHIEREPVPGKQIVHSYHRHTPQAGSERAAAAATINTKAAIAEHEERAAHYGSPTKTQQKKGDHSPRNPKRVEYHTAKVKQHRAELAGKHDEAAKHAAEAAKHAADLWKGTRKGTTMDDLTTWADDVLEKGGWAPIPGGAHGGERRKTATGWEYRYPSTDHAKRAAEHHQKTVDLFRHQAAKLRASGRHERAARSERTAGIHEHIVAGAKKHAGASSRSAGPSEDEKSLLALLPHAARAGHVRATRKGTPTLLSLGKGGEPLGKGTDDADHAIVMAKLREKLRGVMRGASGGLKKRAVREACCRAACDQTVYYLAKEDETSGALKRYLAEYGEAGMMDHCKEQMAIVEKDTAALAGAAGAKDTAGPQTDPAPGNTMASMYGAQGGYATVLNGMGYGVGVTRNYKGSDPY